MDLLHVANGLTQPGSLIVLCARNQSGEEGLATERRGLHLRGSSTDDTRLGCGDPLVSSWTEGMQVEIYWVVDEGP